MYLRKIATLAVVTLGRHVLQAQALASISSDLFGELRLYSQYAAAAYCWSNVTPGKSRVDCKYEGGDCSEVELTDHQIIGTLAMYSFAHSSFGMVMLTISSGKD